MTLDRREFFKTAGVVAVGAAMTGGALATAACSSDKNGANAAGNGDSATEALSATPIKPEGAPKKWDKETDLVIVGTGAGGLVAAAKAAQSRASAVVLEKSSTYGGTSIETNLFLAVGSKVVESAGIVIPIEAFVKGCQSNYSNGAKVPTSKWVTLVKNGAECIDWMGEIGVKWALETLGSGPGRPVVCWDGSEKGDFEARATKPTLDFLHKYAADAGVEFLFSTPVTALVQEGDAITGVAAVDKDGNNVYVKANKGVVLACGGMENNMPLLEKYCPTAASCLSSTACSGNTGDGIRMGMGVDGEIAGFDSAMIFDGGLAWPEREHYLYGGDVQCIRQPWLGINNMGERYTYYPNRDNYGTGIVQTSISLMNQPNGYGYVFFDSHYEEYVPAFDSKVCRKPIRPEMADEGADLSRIPKTLWDWRNGTNAAIKAGVIKKADTIEELAKMLELDPDVVTAAIDRWNKMCESGVDKELGFDPSYLHPIVDPPFYGAKNGGTLLNTSTGLLHNEQQQVIRKDGVPVSGLWVAGWTGGGDNGCSTSGFCSNVLGGVAYSAATGYVAAKDILGG
ncbi:MAG: FAD-binding protein [Coriobacteriia bacterium]